MKTMTAFLLAVAVFVSPMTLAQNSAGKAFGYGVNCVFENGKTMHLPRELCVAYGGVVKH